MRAIAVAAICVPMIAAAQVRLAPSRPVVAQPAGALGGSFASVGISRPLGGVPLPGTQPVLHPPRRINNGYRYIGPVYYTPNAADLESIYDEASSHLGDAPYHPAYPPPPIPTVMRGGGGAVQFSDVPPPPTTIINQYFGKNAAPSGPEENSSAPVEPEAARDYYLIAYKNRNIIAALAYWLDGDTLHYVTSEKAHNQASLALIDLEMTKRLNADRDVPFTIPSR